MNRITISILLFVPLSASAQDHRVHTFERTQLTGTYFSEGTNFGDINGDGHNDVVYGPYWFAGPDFSQKREIYKAVPQPMERYADNFFSWIYDFDGDGANDVLVVGFPGTPAYVYQNPGNDNHDSHWPKHEIFDWVSNESPQFTNIVGDERPELVCTRDGFFGVAVPDWKEPFSKWTFHRISDKVATPRFGHGLGVGDINGDRRADVIIKNGWFEQPSEKATESLWMFHPYEFTRAGGADMFAYDVDGDGDNDVITSLDAHNYGLAWFEQIKEGDSATFRKHLIMGKEATDNKYGVLFTEPHSVNLVDIDGDGMKDICTGKTYWSHHRQSPMWDAGAVVYWFKLDRTKEGVDWIPFKADGESGIGRQLVVGDINKDGLPDMLAGGMKGCHVLMHKSEIVTEDAWREALPRPVKKLASGLSPEEAAKQMTALPGFQLELAAGEPLVHQPIAFTTDHRGRLWVAEAYTYPIRAPEGKGKDKIIILEDTDLDGKLDKRTEFATGLNLVSGLEVGFGGVWVGAAPYLMFIPDTNGDDIPDDDPQILLDGFGYHDTHETLNAFIWGPDGWLYGCHGVFTHSKVGKPGTPAEDRIPMNAAVWRYHPTRHVFEVFAHGTSNPWGVDFNDRGHAFITACVIPHLYHVIQGARYQRQGGRHFNPYTFDDIKTIADHAHYVGNIRDHAWWGHEPDVNHSTSEAGGGHAHCGAMIYLGDNWPDHFRDSIYFNNIHGNRVNNDILERRGSGYVGRHGKDLLLANDRWYRGINLKYGPDGTVHLIDWYDPNACHRTNPEIWDRSNGRVYRLSYGDVAPVSVDLSKLSNIELAKLQLHKNEWYVRMSRRLLQERATNGGVDEIQDVLLEILTHNSDVTRRLRALWTLHAVGKLDAQVLRALMFSDDESLRAWSIQIALESHLISGNFLELLKDIAETDKSSLVRLYVASALQRLSHDQRWEIAERLTQHETDARDHNIPLMIWYGVEPLVPLDTNRAMKLASESKIPLVTKFITRRAASEDVTRDHVVQALVSANDAERHLILDEINAAFEGRVNMPVPASWSEAYDSLLNSDDLAIRDKADAIAVQLGDKRILPRMRSILADTDSPLKKRQQALDVLVRGRDTEAAPAFVAALSEPQLVSSAIKALAFPDYQKTPHELLRRYQTFTQQQKQDAISTLASRPSYANALLNAIANGTVPRTDVHAYTIRQLRRLEDEKLIARLQSIWGTIRESSADKKEKIEEWKKSLSASYLSKANLGHGRLLFNKTCATCHMLFGEGEKIGPDITGSNRANLDYILETAIDPSAVVGKDYQMSVIALSDGRVVTGLIQRETNSALTVRTANDTVIIAKDDIESRKLSKMSLMPDGLFDRMEKDEVRDLVAYLASPSQVPLRGPSAPIDGATGKVPGAIEGESMKLIGKTAGNISSQPMNSFPADRWSDSKQLWWTGAKPEARLDLEFPVQADGIYEIEIVMTRARDYGIVQLSIDDKPLGGPIDLFTNPQVVTTGVIRFDAMDLSKGSHKLSAEIIGTNPKAEKAYMFGLDYIRLVVPTAN